MPKNATNYSKIIIYRIFLNDFVYIGSSTDFIRRKCRHKYNCNDIKCKDIKLYKFINENGGWNNFKMLEIEKFPCNDKNEARTREQYWIDFYKSELNSRKAINTPQEYYQENKEKIAEYHKKYANENKEIIAEKSKEYREENKEKLTEKKKEYYENNKEKIIKKTHEYYENNKEIVLKKQQLYNEKNKEIIKKKKQIYYMQKMTCECGSKFSINDKSKHYKTNKHKQYLELNKLLE